jgi:hypothetical protein
MAKRYTYLISHTDGKGQNAAQAQVVCTTEKKARELFAEAYPQRDISTIGVRG